VEDDIQVREMLSESLREEGFEVATAVSGDEAMASYRDNPADLVIMDIIMPGRDGAETIHLLKKEFPDSRVIAVSGGSANIPGEHLMQTAKRLGADRAFGKPLDIARLLEAIQEVLADRSKS